MSASPDREAPGQGAPAETLSRLTLASFVVGSMVGAGVFSLPGTFAAETGGAGAMVAWALAGTGMLLLALVFQTLALRRPALDAGVYSYARAGFGPYAGFFAAFGYWASACVGNVFYWVFIMRTAGQLFPVLGAGDTVVAIAISSVGLWLFFLLIRRGVREAAGVNRVVSIAKVAPIVVFIIICLTVFDPAVFADNLLGGEDAAPLVEQVRATMLVTVFVFIGIEGASANSRHARSRRDVGIATVSGFLAVLAVFASVTMVSYGVLPRAEIATLDEPSMGGVLAAVVGPWGAAFVGVALIVAVLGAYLSWTLMAAEVLMTAARTGDLPGPLGRTNAHDTPVGALTLSTVLVQVLLVVALLAEDAFTLALELTSALVLIPYFFAAAYGLRVGIADRRRRDAVVAGFATAYTVLLLVGAGWQYLLLALVVIVPGTGLYAYARRRRGVRVFTPAEWVVFALALAGAVAGVVALATGAIAL